MIRPHLAGTQLGKCRLNKKSRFSLAMRCSTLSMVHWVKPELVVEVTCRTSTEDNLLKSLFP